MHVQLTSLLDTGNWAAWKHKPGGARLLRGDRMTEAERTLGAARAFRAAIGEAANRWTDPTLICWQDHLPATAGAGRACVGADGSPASSFPMALVASRERAGVRDR
jgi:hypothetical protein